MPFPTEDTLSRHGVQGDARQAALHSPSGVSVARTAGLWQPHSPPGHPPACVASASSHMPWKTRSLAVSRTSLALVVSAE